MKLLAFISVSGCDLKSYPGLRKPSWQKFHKDADVLTMTSSVWTNKYFSVNPHFSAKQVVSDSFKYKTWCRIWSSLISFLSMVLIPHPYLMVTGLFEFAKMVHLSISRTLLRAQGYHRCQLPLLFLKSTCSHLVITQDRLTCYHFADISSTINTYDWLHYHPGQVLTVFSNMLALLRQALVNKRDIFVVFVANYSSRCHRSWTHTPKIHQFTWCCRCIFRCLLY